MRHYEPKKSPFLDSLDQEIIAAVQSTQFMTSREIWTTIQSDRSNASPSLVYLRVNGLVEIGILGCIEKNLGEATLRRYYCFQDLQSLSREGYFFIESNDQ